MPVENLRGKDAVVTIDATPMNVTDGSYTTGTAVDEMTGLLSEGYYDDVDTIKRATGDITATYQGESPPEFDEGDVVALSITVPGKPAETGPPAVPGRRSGPGLSCNARIIDMTYPIVNPRGGVRYRFTWGSVGAYTKTRGGVIPV
jgi:hypothetical protein